MKQKRIKKSGLFSSFQSSNLSFRMKCRRQVTTLLDLEAFDFKSDLDMCARYYFCDEPVWLWLIMDAFIILSNSFLLVISFLIFWTIVWLLDFCRFFFSFLCIWHFDFLHWNDQSSRKSSTIDLICIRRYSIIDSFIYNRNWDKELDGDNGLVKVIDTSLISFDVVFYLWKMDC